MKFKGIVAIMLSVTTMLSNVTQTSFADEISEAEQDKNESIRQDSVANQTTALNETTSLNQEYVTNQNTESNKTESLNQDYIANQNTESNEVANFSQNYITSQKAESNEATSLSQDCIANQNTGTTETEGISSNINENEAPEKNKVEISMPVNFTAEFEKLEKNSKGGYLDYIKATQLAVNSIESGAKDHVILENMGTYGDKNYYWFSYKALDRVLPNIKRKYFDSESAKPIINKIEDFISQNGQNMTEKKINELISQSDSLKQGNLALARPLFASIGAAAGCALCSLFNFVKNKCTTVNVSYDTNKEQKEKDSAKKSSGLFKAIAAAFGALAGLIYQSYRHNAQQLAIRKTAENKVYNDKKAEFEKLYKELFDNDLKNADCYDMLIKILESVDNPSLNLMLYHPYYYRNEYFIGNEHSCMGIKFDGASRDVSFQGNPIKLDSIEKDAVNQNFDRLIKEIKQFRANNPLNKKNSWEKSLGII